MTLLNMERPTVWDEMSAWRDQDFLMALPDRAKRNMAYAKAEAETPDLFSKFFWEF